MKTPLLSSLFTAALLSAGVSGALLAPSVELHAAGPATAAEPNALTAKEKSAGWELLFDGRTTTGWKGFNKAEFPAQGWEVEDTWLKHRPKGGGGDIVTTRTFGDFELRWEWRIAPGANSGVKYFIDEKRGAPIGHEYQLIDDSLHPDALHGPNRKTSALYDALPPLNPPVRPAGSTNQSRIVVKGAHVEHWLNGKQVVSYDLGSAPMVAAKAASKFKAEERWGTKFPTPILLQDHGDEIWFRNVAIRPLK